MNHIQITEADKNELLIRLSAKQRNTFDEALASYDKVIAENFKKHQRQHRNKTLTPPVYGKFDLINSVLFQRLLNGETPLPFPPPNSFGLPWYQLIDTDKPLRVVVSQTSRSTSILNPKFKLQPNARTIVINESEWLIEDINPAGVNLLSFIDNLDELDDSYIHNYTVLDLLNAEPEFVLLHPSYGQFRLSIGEHIDEFTQWEVDELQNWYGRLKHGALEYQVLDDSIDNCIKLKIKSWLISKL